MDKIKITTGMLYPEILDAQEYNVSLGSQASINRKQRSAQTIEDSFCECNYAETVQFARELYGIAEEEDRALKYDPKRYTLMFDENHARNIRKIVMYNEMHETPTMVGTKGIDKINLDNAYRFHKLYKARWNIRNKEDKQAHEVEMAERRKLGRYTYNFRGFYVNMKSSVFCPDLLYQQLAMWLVQEESPIKLMMQVLPYMYIDDMETLNYTLRDLRAICYSLEDDQEGREHEWLKEKLKGKHKTTWDDADKNISILVGRKHAGYEFLLHVLEGSSFTKGITFEEMVRRLQNINLVTDYHQSLCLATLPWNKDVSFRTLAKQHGYVKKLAKFYQLANDGELVSEVRQVPKSLKQLEELGMDISSMLNEYQPSPIDQMIEAKLNNQLGKPHEIALDKYDMGMKIRWAKTQIRKAKLTKDIASKIRARKNRPSDVGTVPKYMNRWATDRHVWSNKRFQHGGTLAIDMSGSMSLRADQVEEIISALPAATIVGYAGDMQSTRNKTSNLPEGVIEVFAEKGKCVADIDNTFIRKNHYGNNLVDMPVIQWLATQPKPRIMVSDMQCVYITDTKWGEDSSHSTAIDEYCREQARKHDIIILRHVKDAVSFAKKLRNI